MMSIKNVPVSYVTVTTSSYSIRQFRPSDLQNVTRINRATLPENYPDSFFLLIYSSFPQGFLVVEDEKKINLIAYSMNRIETGLSNFSRLRRVKKGHIISIAVLPHVRRLGIGRQIMNRVIDEMMKAGATECFLEVRASNEPAITMYEKRNFEKNRILKKYYSDNESAYLMVLKF